MQLRMKLAAMALAGNAAMLALTGGTAVASTHPATGREVLYGALRNKAAWNLIWEKNPKIPVQLRGLVRTRAAVGHAKTSPYTVRTPVGSLTVRLINRHNSKKLLNNVCRFEETSTYTFAVVGSKSTGAFAGAAGRGAGRTYAAFNFSRRRNGTCNYSKRTVSKHGALISVSVVIPRLTVR